MEGGKLLDAIICRLYPAAPVSQRLGYWWLCWRSVVRIRWLRRRVGRREPGVRQAAILRMASGFSRLSGAAYATASAARVHLKQKRLLPGRESVRQEYLSQRSPPSFESLAARCRRIAVPRYPVRSLPTCTRF